jgi:hypothetical protein
MIQCFTAKKILLGFVILFLVGFPLTSHASCDVTLQWDKSDQNLEGYQVFGREEGQDYDYENPWWQGDSSFLQCTIDSLDESKTYFFVVRAFEGDDMSADSNEVRYAYDDNGAATGAGSGSGSGSVAGSQSSSGCFIESLFHG